MRFFAVEISELFSSGFLTTANLGEWWEKTAGGDGPDHRFTTIRVCMPALAIFRRSAARV